MRDLPLYSALPVAAIEAEPSLDPDDRCTRCELSGLRRATDPETGEERVEPRDAKRPGRVCLGSDGGKNPRPGGVLVVVDTVTQDDDRPHPAGRVLSGVAGHMVRPLVSRWYPGPVTYAAATRCRPFHKLAVEHVEACRGYMARTLEDVRPERIIAMGSLAARSILGRSVQPNNVRTGYAYLLAGRYRDRPIPVYFVGAPKGAVDNRFLKTLLEQDIEYALTRPPPPLPPLDAVVRVVETAEDAEAAVAEMSAAPWCSVDVESAGQLFDPSFRLLCVTATPEREDEALSEDTWTWDEAALANPATRAPLARYLADPRARKCGANVKFDRSALVTNGFAVAGVDGDVRLWRKLLEAEAPADLATMVELVGMGGMKDEQKLAEAPAVDRITFGVHTERRLAKAKEADKKVGKLSAKAADGLAALADLDARLPHIAALVRDAGVESGAWAKAVVPDDTLLAYNGRDGVGTRRLLARLPRDLAINPQIDRIRRLVVDRAARAVARLEEWGVPVDMNALRAFDAHCTLSLRVTRERLDAEVGVDLNPGSPQQLAELLYRKLGFKPTKLTAGGQPSVDEEVLEKLRGKHPVVDLVLDHRKYAGLRSKYAGGMIPHVRPDGRVHCSILLDGAASGRASIKDPPLQQIPSNKRDPLYGKMARDVFAPVFGFLFLQADYKQAEFRVAAMLSQDPVMMADIAAGLDPHLATAKFISRVAWGISPDEVTDEHRSQTKSVVFGVLYGKTAGSLAAMFGCSREQAQKIVDAVMGRYKVLARWIKTNLREAQNTGYVWTQWAGEPARRRPLFDLGLRGDQNEGRRVHAANAATNCLDAETEALTRRGWVRGFDLRPDDVILTKNAATGALEWETMTDLRLFPDYEGPVVEFKSRSFSAVSTPNHRWLVETKSRQPGRRTCERTTRTLSPWGDDRIHRTGEYRPDVDSVLTPDEAELLGWFVTDGSIRKAHTVAGKQKNRRYSTTSARALIHQSGTANAANCSRIDALLARAAPSETTRRSLKNGMVVWNLGRRLSTLLIGLCPTRTLMLGAMLRLNRPALDRLHEAMVLGDRHKRGICTGRREQAEAFQILCTLTGAHASVTYRDMSRYKLKKYPSMGNIPVTEGCWLSDTLNRKTVQVTAGQRREVVARVPVWCPVVPNTFFVARRSDHVFITGNSPIQGGANEFQLASLVEAVEWIEVEGIERDVKLLLPVHDSLLFEVRADMVNDVARKVRQIMTSHDSGGVAMDVDCEVGPAWGSLSKWKDPDVVA